MKKIKNKETIFLFIFESLRWMSAPRKYSLAVKI